ncbi:heme-degrading monooxygenase HmoA [Microbacterium halimionae]|uniref:Heme-degrading monooxygenase HmoA n=1 Tax=Microbacterium halimionae TaxID=1526413 RepID=A0A7W3JQ23_9MICO|nr:antibiotic biosynthesis monooxygenase [Microbacterium halimionae]MBA8816932.1 heme-degrading monooxygenase HmoA [Microbacterium halimionae]NII94529.1 heme-degrading monooxygenase HmoA [Microbacterium halimionae]
MIVRTSEALVRPESRAEFLTTLHALVEGFPAAYPGLIDHEVLVDHHDPDRILYVSRWASEEGLAHYAGVNWATEPVTFPDEDRYLQRPLTLRHFSAQTIDSPTRGR